MPHCVVPGRTNYSQRSDCSISFHRIPSNQQMKKKWLARIPRANPCPTAYSYVCSDHFTSDCFELSLMSQFIGQKKRRRLRAGSILWSSPLSTCRKSTESPPLLDMADNKNLDSDYEPDEESISEDSESYDETDVAMEIIQCKKYLVFESELEKLFSVCPHCTGPITSMAKRNIGSMVVISYSCINGHSSHWNSHSSAETHFPVPTALEVSVIFH